ncbi:MAG: hypothetical protein ACJATT_003482, partial [Myxococcota bacterium]
MQSLYLSTTGPEKNAVDSGVATDSVDRCSGLVPFSNPI